MEVILPKKSENIQMQRKGRGDPVISWSSMEPWGQIFGIWKIAQSPTVELKNSKEQLFTCISSPPLGARQQLSMLSFFVGKHFFSRSCGPALFFQARTFLSCSGFPFLAPVGGSLLTVGNSWRQKTTPF